jgi:3-hydroxyacyl-CoA dehydrogenase
VGQRSRGAFLWKTLSKHALYAAKRIPEIADNVVEVDRAMRWGFRLGARTVRSWDAIGVEKSVARMKEEGIAVPANVEQMLASGATSFYKKEERATVLLRLRERQVRSARDPAGV